MSKGNKTSSFEIPAGGHVFSVIRCSAVPCLLASNHCSLAYQENGTPSVESEAPPLSGACPPGSGLEGFLSETAGVEGFASEAGGVGSFASEAFGVEGLTAAAGGAGGTSTENSCSSNNSPVFV